MTLWKSRTPAPRRRIQLHVEPLEARNLLSPTVIEDFEAPNSLAAYTTVLRYAPAAELSPVAAHDGGLGLVKHDGYEWLVRNDLGAQVHGNEVISVWVDLAGAADGRAYFGFGATPNGLNRPLYTGGTLSLVLAPNTNQLILQENLGFGYQDLAAVFQTYEPDHWYQLQIDWGANGTIVGGLYNSDGTTLLNQVVGFTGDITAGGIAFRAFGSDKYFDTVTVDEPGVAAGRRPAGGAVHPVAVPAPLRPPPIRPQDGDIVLPFQYQSVPGTGIDMALTGINQLQQIAIVGDQVGLAGVSNAYNAGSVQVGWGPIVQGLDSPAVPVETPTLEQYIFRQRPGEVTTAIGSSDLKHFAGNDGVDPQHLLPGQGDTYGINSNDYQPYYSPASELDPVTGAIPNLDSFGPRDVNGLNQWDHHGFSSPIEHLLQVNVADLDPAQNPPGTRWFLAGELWTPGDEDVSTTSRWVEIVPSFDGATFTFSYPQGSAGQYNLRTIPGLGAGPAVIAQTPTGTPDGPVDTVEITFNRPINPDTFTPDQVASFTGPNGPIAVTSITPVGSDNTTFDIHFDPQGTLGVYTMVIGPDIQDQDGNPMDQSEDGVAGQTPDDQYTATFAIRGPQIVAMTPLLAYDAFPVDHVRVTFNKPINVDTFTPDQVDSLTGPSGPIAVTGVSVVPSSGDTQFDVWFDPQTQDGTYTIVIGPDIEDRSGNPMDQNGNYVGGENPGDLFQGSFPIVTSVFGPDGFGYTGTAAPFQNNDILNQPGTFTIIDAADDLAVPVDLGSNTVNFYGTTYSGANQLYVSSNGIITFGGGDSGFVNTDLTTYPIYPTVSVLWTDWFKSSGDPTGPMIVGQFTDYDDSGVPHELIIEWNQIQHVRGAGRVTFQAILSLNTGDQPSAVVLNYLNLQSGDEWAEGNEATVGIKDAASQGPNRLLINDQFSSPFVGTGEAFQFTASFGPAAGSTPWAALARIELLSEIGTEQVRGELGNGPLPPTAGLTAFLPEDLARTGMAGPASRAGSELPAPAAARKLDGLLLADGLTDPLGDVPDPGMVSASRGLT